VRLKLQGASYTVSKFYQLWSTIKRLKMWPELLPTSVNSALKDLKFAMASRRAALSGNTSLMATFSSFILFPSARFRQWIYLIVDAKSSNNASHAEYRYWLNLIGEIYFWLTQLTNSTFRYFILAGQNWYPDSDTQNVILSTTVRISILSRSINEIAFQSKADHRECV